MRMLRKARNMIAVIHAILGTRVEIGTVSSVDEFTLASRIGGIGIFVIDAEEKWIERWVRPSSRECRCSEDGVGHDAG